MKTKKPSRTQLTDEAERDLNRIGLVLDTLKIQNVSDDVGYLEAIGRMRSAQIRRNAQVAEAEAQAQAAGVKWENHMRGEVAKIEAQITIAREDNQRRVVDAQTKRAAMIAEQQATVQAAIAQANAEVQMQEARIEQVRHQLIADIVQPAEAEKQKQIARAKANAVKIVEQGKATANVLKDLSKAYRSGGASRTRGLADAKTRTGTRRGKQHDRKAQHRSIDGDRQWRKDDARRDHWPLNSSTPASRSKPQQGLTSRKF